MMTFTVTFGWWLLPLFVTFFACFASWNVDVYDSVRGHTGYGDGIVSFFVWCPAVIVSLIAWLIWAVLT